MAWFGEGLSSLRGQLSNLAKGVLVEEEDNAKSTEDGALGSSYSQLTSDVTQVGSGWSEAEEDSFIGQDIVDEKKPEENETHRDSSQSVPLSNNGNVETDVATMIPKGIAQFFHQIGNATLPTDLKRGKHDQETQTEPSPALNRIGGDVNYSSQLREQNAQLSIEVESLRRMVRELESQIALSQDENANLSTGLEELDIQHQEAIERILTVKDETHKELEQLKEQLKDRDAEFDKLFQENENLNKQVEMMSLELIGNETLAQENAHLREKIGELVKAELPAIPEQSAAEDHVRSLEAEVSALRESRDNLERETTSLQSQIRQRDANLRQVDAKLEEVTNEKEIKEREMTQIVFECNSLREELKAAASKIELLEKDAASDRDENQLLKTKLEELTKEADSMKIGMEASKREMYLAKDECETLKAELKSLKEELDGGEAKAVLDWKEIEQAKKDLKNATAKVESLQEKVSELEKKMTSSQIEFNREKVEFELERQTLENELDILRDVSREYGIQKDIFKEKESELKRQMAAAESDLSNACNQLSKLDKENTDLKHFVENIQKVNTTLTSRAEASDQKDREISEFKKDINEMQRQNESLRNELEHFKKEYNSIVGESLSKNVEGKEFKSTLSHLQDDIKGYQNNIMTLEEKISSYELQLSEANNSIETLKEKESYYSDIDIKSLINENNNLCSENRKLLDQMGKCQAEITEHVNEKEKLSTEYVKLKENINQLINEKEEFFKEHKSIKKVNETLLKETGLLSNKNEALLTETEELKEKIKFLSVENSSMTKELHLAQNLISHSNCLEPFGGIAGSLEKLSHQGEELDHLRHQVDHLRDELKESYEVKVKLTTDLSSLTSERKELLKQINILRKELESIVTLKQENENIKQQLQMKHSELLTQENEIKRLNNALSIQLNNNDCLYKEKSEMAKHCELLNVQLQSKMSSMEQMEKMKSKEIESLKQEVETLKTQLEYASQLLQDVERQEGEGQPSGEQNNLKPSSEVQEELTRLSAALLKEQTDCKLYKNQLEERQERLDKAENQLRTLKSHLVEIQDSYSSELSATEEKLREMQTQLMAAEERARTSSTAYTSASIRANQQVESLREQLRLMTEQKEKLDHEVSVAEDTAAKQAAAVTRLQAVLHQFHIDKQKDIDFETERIRRDLVASEKRNEALGSELKGLQDQLAEARKGLAAGQRLSEELLRQTDVITQLKSEIFELKEKLRLKEEKVNDLNSDSKVDRTLVKNLLVGYVTSPDEAKPKALGVLSQVLSLSKEERQKIGLEPGGRQQTLSEAFIKFLQSESQVRPEVILPLNAQADRPPSRKSSLLTQEVPVLLHFPASGNPVSILKDVLQERRPE